MWIPKRRMRQPERASCGNMNFLVRIVPLTLVMGTIFFLSAQSGDSIDLSLFPGEDKVAHLTAYGALAFTFIWFCGKEALRKPGLTAVVTLLFCFLYGISDEYHQSFVEQRYVSGFDLLADTTGAFLLSMVWLKSASLQAALITYQQQLTGKCVLQRSKSE